MTQESLAGLKVAILVTDGFEQVELTEPRDALAKSGAEPRVVSPKKRVVSKKDKIVRGWNHTEWGTDVPVDVNLEDAEPNKFDALVLPGGVINPDHLRMDAKAVAFVKAFFDAGKPVAAICHGPWTIINAGAAKGRRITSYPSLQADLHNAGANWVDEDVVVDRNLVTSRKPDDLPAFKREMLKLFATAHSKSKAA